MFRWLNPNRALIFRVTHIDNVPWILGNGLHCQNSCTLDHDFVQIGNPDLIKKRRERKLPVPTGGTLADYIPFYFTPFPVMMYNIKTGHGSTRHVSNAQIVIMVSSLRTLVQNGLPIVFTDRHAYLQTARFFTAPDDPGKIDREILQRRDFRRDDNDPGKMERYQAEALVYRHLPVGQLQGIVCHSKTEQGTLEQQQQQRGEAGHQPRIVAWPGWYF
ncbi:MAG: DUF4433 domain-containing protein [Rhodobacteraceae bacterium]|nr:DUF4433 domain-containing protein [Paracoccaceae bacterium]